ncbi:MAG: glucose 1-dehydrogenase [Chloroflexi bacterium]|nr:glucose 1-dehydrogenase [Chloroflexota bacterium]
MRLKGKVAIVTGAARGLGAEISTMFAREGARIVLTDQRADDGEHVAAAIRDTGGLASFTKHDVASEADWQRVVNAALREFGKIDVLVNNAAILRTEGVLDTDLTLWNKVLAVNSTGVFLGTREVVPHMKKHGGGSIVNVASVSANIGSPSQAAYNTSKAAVRMFTKTAALEFAPDRIRVNSVHPGPLDTTMLKEVYEAADLESFKAAYPLGRRARPIEVAYGVLFLASDESSYMTGSELIIDGGLSAQ